MCFGCSKEPSHRDGSFEYPQHMFWLRNKKNNFHLRTLIWGPVILFNNVQIIQNYLSYIARKLFILYTTNYDVDLPEQIHSLFNTSPG